MTAPLLPLSDGHSIPALGLGTYGLRGDDGIGAMTAALESGYRLLDTALNYENEREVGEALRRSGLPREEVVVTTKLPGRFHGRSETREGFRESLDNLGLDYVDLYLIHWPLPRQDRYVDAWRTMIELRDEGLIRSIGVSNFTEAHLERLRAETGELPVVNQIELHPYFSQSGMREVHERLGIVTQSWSPLAKRRDVAEEPVLEGIARDLGRSVHQVVLRWHVQIGALPIPKSGDPERQRANLDVFGFELSDDQMSAIAGLESDRLWGADPDTHEEF